MHAETTKSEVEEARRAINELAARSTALTVKFEKVRFQSRAHFWFEVLRILVTWMFFHALGMQLVPLLSKLAPLFQYIRAHAWAVGPAAGIFGALAIGALSVKRRWRNIYGAVEVGTAMSAITLTLAAEHRDPTTQAATLLGALYFLARGMENQQLGIEERKNRIMLLGEALAEHKAIRDELTRFTETHAHILDDELRVRVAGDDGDGAMSPADKTAA